MRKYIYILVGLFVWPVWAHAAVLINEVAWMGTSANANAEWIELTNTGGSSVDLTGWKLVAASGSPNITLSGSIASGGYFLLERTSEDSVPGVTADQIYTGALTNSGTTLTLSDAASAVQDTVVGGANWATIGGDNTTKDTAQRTSTGWTTAAGTPRAANSGSLGGSASSTNSVATATTSASSSSASTYTPPPSAISIDLTGDSSATLEVPAHFFAQVKTKAGTVDAAAQVFWTFGDGSASTGTSVEKVFHYPGMYLVTARGEDGSAIAYDEVLIAATASIVKIPEVNGDGIVLENDTTSRLDLSGWQLSSGTGIFRMPKGTALLPNSKMLFPNTITNLPVTLEATLSYPSGTVAAQYSLPVAPVVVAAVQPPSVSTSSLSVQTIVTKHTAVITTPHEPKAVSAPATEAITAVAGAAVLPAPEKGFFHSPWVVGFLGILAVSGGAFMIL